MDIPKRILDKVDRAHRHYQKKLTLINEIEDWLTKQGLDVEVLRNELDVITELDYGMTSEQFKEAINSYLEGI
ncbi:hypothetical protein [Aneurinibacillus migulanus]|uniref:Uncharacterized protein n=1 Tax=Aneurinibacillus migulanus TaxID=47500 RepID=A0A0D1XPB1_ANEMI|nr:hypothetical protein [Aneurinibacillus migulanus]KIV56201.1 hypothetical protein TS65_13340 [Aneurinibacillus migulanus]KON84265.1 hypothetical protein AF333_30485 [Aneurinibacillus migulanus]MED0893811.1 hypothetical protein [Aneurinibacillus migulanus]MED1614490.1 hypothetical protein [Aneurinibacillus migulanus]SDI83529.1 hypothetical protein SAMN04487909_108111 [Aneurinibacillus migulanus]